MRKATSALLFGVSVAGSLAAVARAEQGSAPKAPIDAGVCKNGYVDGRRLVNELLASYYASQETPDPDGLLAELKALPSGPGATAAALDAAEDKDTNILRVLADTRDLLSGKYSKSFKSDAPAGTSAIDFFSQASNTWLACVSTTPTASATGVSAQTTAAAAGGSGTPPAQADGWRIRGVATDLAIDKSEAAFASASKATISLNDNYETKTQADQFKAAIGYGISPGNSSTRALVFYVGGDYADSAVTKKPDKISADTVDFGLAAAFQDVPWSGTLVTIAPDYLLNFQDHSRIFSLHPILTPQIPGFLNWGMNLGTRVGACTPAVETPCLSWPTLTLYADLHGDFGYYTNRGIPSAQAANQNFARIGSRFGFDISDVKAKNAGPISYDLTVTDTALYGPVGSHRKLNDFNSSATFYVGGQTVLGLTISYDHGIIEQTTQPQDLFTAGVTVKY